MAFEVKDIVESLGWDKAPETRSEFEEKLKKEFVPRSALKDDPDVFKLVGDQTGKRLGQLDTLIRQQAKEVGVEKIEGEKYEEIIPHIFSTIKTNLEALKSADKKTKDQKFLEVEEERNKYKSQYETQKELADKANQLYEQEKKERAEFQKSWTTNHQHTELKKQVPFTDDFKKDPLQQTGFDVEFEKKYVKDLDDKGNIVYLYRETGKPVTNSTGNQIIPPIQVLTDFAEQMGKKANNNLNPITRKQEPNPQNNGQGGNVPGHGYKKKS